MGQYETLLKNVLTMKLRAKEYGEIWDMMLKDSDVYQALFEIDSTQDDLIGVLDYHGPAEADEVIEGELEEVCSELLPRAHKKGWYKLCGFIYGMGYCTLADPLCGSEDPLIFAAKQHNAAFAEAYLEGQKRFNYLSFDGSVKCDDGVCRTFLEQLVVLDDVDVFALCIKNGANPNAFGFRGDRLLDVAHSSEMQKLLLDFGAKKATEQERNLVRLVNELQNDCLKGSTVKAFFATQPLMRLSWYNGTTEESREQRVDAFLAAAQACHAELLEKLCPYAEKDLDDSQRQLILDAILDMDQLFPCRDIMDERPIDVPRSLEALCSAGFRYGINCDPAIEHPVVNMLCDACWAFFFNKGVPVSMQLRTFSALWEMGGSPKDCTTVQAIKENAHRYPKSCLEEFVSGITSSC